MCLRVLWFPLVKASSYRPFRPSQKIFGLENNRLSSERNLVSQSDISHSTEPLVTVAPTRALRFITVPLR